MSGADGAALFLLGLTIEVVILYLIFSYYENQKKTHRHGRHS